MESIRSARKKKGWTQEMLASAINVKRAVISKYESGAISPKLETLQRIADALGVPLTDLLPVDDLILTARRTDKEITNKEEVAKSIVAANRAEMLDHFDSLKFEWQQNGTAYIKALCADPMHIRESYADEVYGKGDGSVAIRDGKRVFIPDKPDGK